MIRLLILGAVLVSCSGLPYGGRYGSRYSSSYKQQTIVQRPATEVTKSFYFFAAPDDEEFRQRTPKRVTTSTKKNLDVIVIKAPEVHSYTETSYELPKEDELMKTLVYLLSKQPDTREIVRSVQHSHKHHAPEVRFIKFKTTEEEKRFLDAIGSSKFDTPSTRPNSIDVPAGPVFGSTDSTPKSFDSESYDDDELFTARHPPFLPTGVDVVPGSSYLPPRRD